MTDSIDSVWQKFYGSRTADLFNRFHGLYRAIVEETNDPLQMHRIRFRMPEFHDKSVEVKHLPWAVPSFSYGGKGSGSWTSPSIGDYVWISFEKSHPYGPVWLGSSDPTRRKLYPHQSISGKTPLSLDDKGEPDGQPQDYEEDYLPKDGRPMSAGIRDRYGSFISMNSTGFYPKEHDKNPTPVGTDPQTKADFESSDNSPETNKPDTKYIVANTKYGHMFILNDVGYKWDEEFSGDFNDDEDFEVERSKYLTKFFNEEEPEEYDQRRIELRTRYGHKFEMRDVGWDKSRSGEYEDQVDVGDSKDRDERWIKIKTKGGHHIDLVDVGFDAEQDEFIKKLNKSDVGDTEDIKDFGEDARFIRFQTRYGFQAVFDDRGSDSKSAHDKEEPRGNGILMKTRREERGHHLQMCDKDEQNHICITTAKGQTIEQNDRFNYTGISTKTSEPLSTKRVKLEGVEWIFNTLLGLDFEENTFHIKLDDENKYARMKTPKKQGIEFRDGDGPCMGWAEIRDEDDRGIWFSKENDYAVWRSKDEEMYIALDDGNSLVLIKNTKENIQIHAKKNVEICGDQEVIIKAGNKISLKAGTEVSIEAGGTNWTVSGGSCGTNDKILCREMSGKHTEIQKPLHPNGFASPAPKGGGASDCDPKELDKKKPEDDDKDRGCAPNKSQAGPIPPENFRGGGGPGGNTGGSPSDEPTETDPPLESPRKPDNPSADPPPERIPADPDPLSLVGGSGGVLWYGTSTEFLEEIINNGLNIDSFTNNLNEPPDTDASEFNLATSVSVARGDDFAKLAVERHGGEPLILRIISVDEPELLEIIDQDLVKYTGETIDSSYIEVFDF